MQYDEQYMQRVFDLARLGRGKVNPNPLVGAILVRDGQIIGEGAHRQYGHAHAEIDALNNAKESAQDATLYVNLEPCTYDGKTPPCVPAIIQAGIRRVVIANRDPNPKVNGKGIQQLREAGLDVEVGLLESAGLELNRGFMKSMSRGFPWVTLKLAITLDGFIADDEGKSRWITGEESRKQVHQWRSEHNAILVGVGTVKTDDPSLTVRSVDGENPVRIILSGEQTLPKNSKVLTDQKAPTILIRSEHSGNSHENNSQSMQTVYLVTDEHGEFRWEEVLEKLYLDEGILSVFVEGGAGVASSLMDAGLVDELILMVGSKLIGQGLSPFRNLRRSMEEAIRWRLHDFRPFGDDVSLRYRRKEPE